MDLSKEDKEIIQRAVNVLSCGGVIIYPTDTFYCLGANAFNAEALERVFNIKERSFLKPLPILIKNFIWAEELAEITRANKERLKKIWPGEVTAILPKKNIVFGTLTARLKTVGMRIADYKFTDQLLGKFGYPITSTSASVAGMSATGDIEQIKRVFKDRYKKPDLIIDAGILRKSDPSSVIDLTASKPRILKIGPSRPEQLMKLLEI